MELWNIFERGFMINLGLEFHKYVYTRVVLTIFFLKREERNENGKKMWNNGKWKITRREKRKGALCIERKNEKSKEKKRKIYNLIIIFLFLFMMYIDVHNNNNIIIYYF